MGIRFIWMLLVFLSAGISYAQDISPAPMSDEMRKDLRDRICDFDETGYKLAIEDINRSMKGRLGKESSVVLENFSKRKESLLSGIAAGDQGICIEAKQLLKALDDVLLSNPLLKDKEVFFIRRHFDHDSARNRTGGGLGLAPSNFQNNSEIGNPAKGWDNEFVSLKVGEEASSLSVVYKPEQGAIISDPELHWDGERMMYSAIGTHGKWHLFELSLSTKEVRQLTPEIYEDFDSFDGCYTPDGGYVFCSTATFLGLPCTDGGNKMCGIFSYHPETKTSRQLTFDQDSNWNPVLMESGQILYQRWEYADLPHSNSRFLFSMNPDGTSQLAYYGSGSYFPTAFFGARPIPGKPGMVVGVAGGHHSVSRGGQLLVINTGKGQKEAEGVIAEIPYRGKPVEAEVRDRLPDGKWPQFLSPYPLNEKYYLVSMKKSPRSLWGIYLVDVYNNITLIHEEEGCAMLDPIVVEKKAKPGKIPSRVNPDVKTATIFVQDVYSGKGLEGIPRGTVKKLRVGSYSFSPIGQGGLLGTIGLDGPWDVKKVLGEVTVEEDGSASFTVPANTPVFLQPLDSEGKALQVMRSWFTAMPGENLSCVGCHEGKGDVMETRKTIASRKSPQPISPFYEKERGISFLHEVQPTLDRACAGCHNGTNPALPYLKGDKMLTDWTSQISGRGDPSYAGKFTESYYQLQRYVRRPGIESDMNMLAPMDVHADQTELLQILNKGHHHVSLTKEEREKLVCWIDMNAPYHGRREDIPSFPRTKYAYDMRKKYEPVFNLHRNDSVWLPEKKEGIKAEIPVADERLAEESPALKGWPHYTSGTHYEAGPQINLGYFRKSVDLGNGIKMNFIKVPAGEFVMGSNRNQDEMPMHVKKIDKPFWIGQFEVTNRQYGTFDENHDSRTEHRHGYQFGRKGYPLNDPDQPAVRISWKEAMNFCSWLSDKTGLHVSLPTETQWEWACRAGSGRAYSFGDMGADYTLFANMGDKRLKEYAACTAYKFYESVRLLESPNRYDDWVPHDDQYDDGSFVSEKVGKFEPNSWDLYDMHGNVWEWTLSAYKPYPATASEEDVTTSEKRVARGGSWYDRPYKCTSTFRVPYSPYQKVFNVGFRVVLNE